MVRAARLGAMVLLGWGCGGGGPPSPAKPAAPPVEAAEAAEPMPDPDTATPCAATAIDPTLTPGRAPAAAAAAAEAEAAAAPTGDAGATPPAVGTP